eukprot:4137526-Pleurochrysis_carterae.AAC.1
MSAHSQQREWSTEKAVLELTPLFGELGCCGGGRALAIVGIAVSTPSTLLEQSLHSPVCTVQTCTASTAVGAWGRARTAGHVIIHLASLAMPMNCRRMASTELL